MSLHWQKPGVNHVGEYQASGHAFVMPDSTTDREVNLKYVASAVTVTCTGAGDTITFYDGEGVARSIDLSAAGTYTFNVKFVRLGLTGSSTNAMGAVIALTNIPAASYEPSKWGSMGTIYTT